MSILTSLCTCISYFLYRNRYNNAQPAHAQSVRVGHTGAVTGLDIPQERQGKVSAKIQQLLNTLKVRGKVLAVNYCLRRDIFGLLDYVTRRSEKLRFQKKEGKKKEGFCQTSM